MSFLTPLYIMGLLAVSLPVLFHLIRRSPRGRVLFSSLLFLTPSPPRVARRSRLDNLLLLLLRGLAILLISLAFARPFLREAAQIGFASGERYTAVLVDRSASMQRDGLWEATSRELAEVLSDARPTDRVALFTFDHRLQTLVGFEDKNQGNGTDVVRERFQRLKPGWGGTDLGAALVSLADLLDSQLVSAEQHVTAERRIVLISDLQSGSNLEALQAYEWPAHVSVQIRQVEPAKTGNAGLHLVSDGLSAKGAKVRLMNSRESSAERFQVKVANSSGVLADIPPVNAYVLPGKSRILQVPLPESAEYDRLILTGDGQPFDNVLHLAPRRQPTLDLVYLGTDPKDDPQGLRYYLEQALSSITQWKIRLSTPAAEQPLTENAADRSPLVVAVAPLSESRLAQLQQILEAGGNVLYVLHHPEPAGLEQLLHAGKVEIEEAQPSRYAMLGSIDFGHPLFASFRHPRYSDFTKIHFWNYRRLKIENASEVHVLARFDNGDPAVLERTGLPGTLTVLTSGWHPQDSQLALTTKFVPLVLNLLERAAGRSAQGSQFEVGQLVQPPPGEHADVQIRRPDGAVVKLPNSVAGYRDTETIGRYEWRMSDTSQPFAVNVAAQETNTAPLDVEQLAQRGVSFETKRSAELAEQQRRQMRNVELESQQQLWRWLVVAGLGVLLTETWLAGRLGRMRTRSEE